MPLINCKVELRLKWAKYCVLSAGRDDNDKNYFYFKRQKIICLCCNFISKRQSKIIKTFEQRI